MQSEAAEMSRTVEDLRLIIRQNYIGVLTLKNLIQMVWD